MNASTSEQIARARARACHKTDAKRHRDRETAGEKKGRRASALYEYRVLPLIAIVDEEEGEGGREGPARATRRK